MISDAQRLEEPKHESDKLKKLLAESMFDRRLALVKYCGQRSRLYGMDLPLGVQVLV